MFLTEYFQITKFDDLDDFISMHSTYIKKKYGDAVYKSLVDGLLSEMVVRMSEYSNSEKNPFCKEFKIKDEYRVERKYLVKSVEFKISQTNPYWFHEGTKQDFKNRVLIEQGLNTLSINENTYKDLDANISMEFSKLCVELKDWKLSRKDRVYSALTNMKKNVRGCLLMNENDISWADVKCCQPYLMLSEFQCATERAYWIRFLNADVYKVICKSKCFKKLGTDRDRMKKIVSGYIAGCGDGSRDKEESKEPDDLKREEKAAIHRFMKHYFPKFYKQHQRAKHKDSYKYLSCKLMKLESDIVIDRVLPRLGFDAVTIHDCVGCEVQNVEKLKQIMIEEFTAVIGIEPQIGIEQPVSPKASADDDLEAILMEYFA